VTVPMREAFARTATDLFRDDPNVAIVLAEISTQLFDEAFVHDPSRIVNVGIAEGAMVGVAAGFAMEGFHPIAHSLSPFMAERPYEQLKLDFGYQGLGGAFVGSGGSYDYAGEGGTHHPGGDAAAMLAIPGMQVLVPGSGDELDRLLRSTYATFDMTTLAVVAGDRPHVIAVEPWYEGTAAPVLTRASGTCPRPTRSSGCRDGSSTITARGPRSTQTSAWTLGGSGRASPPPCGRRTGSSMCWRRRTRG
jgi:transketolase-like protein